MDNLPITEYFVELVGVNLAFRRGFEEGNAKATSVKSQQFGSEAQCARMLNFLFLERLEMGQLTEDLYRTHIGYLLGLLNGCTFRLKEGNDAETPTIHTDIPLRASRHYPSKPTLRNNEVKPLNIIATGSGSWQMCLISKYGFPRTKPKVRHKSYLGFQTGDIVKAIVPSGTHKGTHEGRVSIRFKPQFHLNGFDVAPKYLRRVHYNDGYQYEKGESHALSRKA